MPIGPALPPHLAHLARASDPGDEEEDQPGPSIRSTTPPGPLPAPIQTKDDEEEADDFGPALPPHLAAARRSKGVGPSPPRTNGPASVGSRGRGRVGPSALPPDDDSDDDIGPRPDPSFPVQEQSAVQEFMEREARWAREREEAAKPKVLTREEWMLVPPSSGVLASVDPLRKRPTTFSRSTRPIEPTSSVWTETPVEKAQRIADEVAGIKRPRDPKRPAAAEGGGDAVEAARKRRRDEEIREEVERHNKTSRGPSLLDKHLAKSVDKDDKEPAAIWDHERDMGITGRLLNDQERQQKIKEARGLNDRFGHSKQGAFSM